MQSLQKKHVLQGVSVLVIVGCFLTPVLTAASAEQELLKELMRLEPLPKVHYSWGLAPGKFLMSENKILYELARLTHALSVFGANAKPEWIDNCVYTCARVNKTNPPIPCSIGIVYDIWHHKFRPDLEKPIPNEYDHTVFDHPTYAEEIEFFVHRSSLIRQWISESNKKYGTDVKVGALLLDCERFHRRPNDPAWNAAVARAVNDIHVRAVELFPEARIEWYERAGKLASNSDTATWNNVYFFYDFIMTGMSMSWYSPTEPEKMKNLFQKDCDFADTYEIDGKTPWKGMDMTPWVALAWGRDWDRFAAGIRGTDEYKDWDYDLSYSRQMGALLNSFDPPYDRAKVVVFFPSPFRKKSAPWYDLSSPWGKHFIEYCKGAAQAN